MQKIRWFFLIVGILLALLMGWQNTQNVDIRLLWITHSLPLSVLLLSFTAIGFLFGALMTAAMLHRRRATEKKRKKAVPGPAAPAPVKPNPLTK